MSGGLCVRCQSAEAGPGATPYCPACQVERAEEERRRALPWTVGVWLVVLGFVALVVVRALNGDDVDDGGDHPADRRAEEVCGDLEEPARSECAVRVFEDYLEPDLDRGP